MSSAAVDFSRVFDDHRGFLFGLCYRMTGSVTDAEDLVQETFLRALSRPPRDLTRPWRPWLVRVAMNLARDQLRRRRRRSYVGPWLPEPMETGSPSAEPSFEPLGTAGRYELLESVSFAFLVALEALPPAQRAVLLLRDVCQYSGSEVAAALDMTEANVRTTLHRARRRMAGYEAHRCRPGPALVEQTSQLLQRFLACMAEGDVAGMQSLLCEDAAALSDGGGVYSAARVPVLGGEKVARFHRGLMRGSGPPARAELVMLNGLPALVAEYAERARDHLALRFVMVPIPDGSGRLQAIHTLVAPGKIGHLRAWRSAGS